MVSFDLVSEGVAHCSENTEYYPYPFNIFLYVHINNNHNAFQSQVIFFPIHIGEQDDNPGVEDVGGKDGGEPGDSKYSVLAPMGAAQRAKRV